VPSCSFARCTWAIDAAPTERERQIADLVVDRKTNPQIAAELFLSVKTIEAHMRNLFRKLEVSSRDEALERARQRALI
jgi:DNA-binding CsgD family transcriptional regulator